jgi:hypothetical protein
MAGDERDACGEGVMPLIAMEGGDRARGEIETAGMREALEIRRCDLSRWREEDQRRLQRQIIERDGADICLGGGGKQRVR